MRRTVGDTTFVESGRRLTIHTSWETLVRAATRSAPEAAEPEWMVRCVELRHTLWRGVCKLEAEMRLWEARAETSHRGGRWWRAGGVPYTFEVV